MLACVSVAYAFSATTWSLTMQAQICLNKLEADKVNIQQQWLGYSSRMEKHHMQMMALKKADDIFINAEIQRAHQQLVDANIR